MIAQQHFAGPLHGRQQGGVAREVGDAQVELAGLARAEHFAGTAQFEILLGDAKAVAGFAQYVQALARSADSGAWYISTQLDAALPRPTRPRN